MSIKELDWWCCLRDRCFEVSAHPGRGWCLLGKRGYRVKQR